MKVVAGFVARDPFLMIGYHDDVLPPASKLSETPGFPRHPHAGFETITITIDAMVDHADSLGGSGRYGNGDVQFMYAGRGVEHSEMAGLISYDGKNGGALFQLWLNAAEKRLQPNTSMLWSEDIPTEKLQGGTLKTIAPTSRHPEGSWAFGGDNVRVLLVTLERPGASCSLDGKHQLCAYVFKGSATLNGQRVPAGHSAIFEEGQTSCLVETSSSAEILVIDARPIRQPVYSRGPFISDTQAGLDQCFADYRRKLSSSSSTGTSSSNSWTWASEGPTHGTSPRFYDDGKGHREERGPSIKLYAPGPPVYLPHFLSMRR